MKHMKTFPSFTIRQENFMSADMWNQCCGLVFPYADQVNVESFCAMNLLNKNLDDLKNRIVFTAHTTREMVGFFVGSIRRRPGVKVGHGDWLFVDMDMQGQGVGSALMDKFEGYARRKHGVDMIELEVANGTHKFYEGLGYRRDSVDYDLMRKYFSHTK